MKTVNFPTACEDTNNLWLGLYQAVNLSSWLLPFITHLNMIVLIYLPQIGDVIVYHVTPSPASLLFVTKGEMSNSMYTAVCKKSLKSWSTNRKDTDNENT